MKEKFDKLEFLKIKIIFLKDKIKKIFKMTEFGRKYFQNMC